MRVIIAEDGFMRDLLARSFPDYGLQVCGQARTTQELIELVDADPPDIVTVDINMPRTAPDGDPEYGAGVETAHVIRQRHPDVAILALSQHAEVPWAEEIASRGMSVGYQLKDRVQDMDALVETMRAVNAGDIRIDRTLIAALVGRKRVDDPVQNLSAREREVLQLMAEGLLRRRLRRGHRRDPVPRRQHRRGPRKVHLPEARTVTAALRQRWEAPHQHPSYGSACLPPIRQTAPLTSGSAQHRSLLAPARHSP
jgi:DNA-binding NarL/FixJ family response regulator